MVKTIEAVSQMRWSSHRTEVEAETPQEAMEKIESSNGDIVDRSKDVCDRHGFETLAVYDEEDN